MDDRRSRVVRRSAAVGTRLGAAGLMAASLAVASVGSPGGQARAGTVGTAGALVGAPAAMAAGATAAGATGGWSGPVGRENTAPVVVTLPTGDNIAVTDSGGRQEASLLPGSPDRQFTEFNLGGDLYIAPEAALHGGNPDLAQFDLTRLAAGQPTAPAQSATGAGSYKLHTLTVNGIDDTGQPDQGDVVIVVNLTDTRLFSMAESFYQGQFKVSVPGGDYALLSFFYDTQLGTVHLVVLPQVSVTADRAVTLDARTATTPITVATPMPANSVEEAVTVDRAATENGNAEYSFIDDTQQPLSWYATPTSPVSEGALHYYVYDRLYSPAGVTPAYSYALEFPTDDAIPANQAYTATPDQLAAQDTSYYAAGQALQTAETRFSFLPWEFFNFRADSDFTRPLQRTEYYTGNPDISWQSQLFMHVDLVTHAIADEFQDSFHNYASGQHTTVSWLAGPLRQGTEYDQQTRFGFACPACREPGKLDFFIWPFGDNDAGHVGFPQSSDTASYTLSSAGNKIASGTGMLLGAFTVPNKAATYVLTYDVARAESWWTQSTSVQTQWTFQSAPGGGSPPPANWACLDGAANCTPLPLLVANYQLPVNPLGQEQPGAVSFGLRIGHFQNSDGAAVTGATAAVSFDGGTTWTDANVTGQAGDYTASYSNPQAAATDGSAAIRITAKDADGGELTQTIRDAYAIAP